MTFSDWTKPSLYGALGGAIATSVPGFSFGGWTTSGTAQEMAQDYASEEVTLAMVPVCLDMSATDPERAEKLASMDTGWATLPGTDTPNRDLAAACIVGHELDGS